jgi:predicted amidophosphoribosyltransferase
LAISPSGAFDCPECGTRVFGSEMRCSGCGMEFAEGAVVLCPSCGREVPAENARCTCGSYVGGRCRRCGLQLRKDDRVCPRCGRHSVGTR